ncbi:hypothetical protein [Phytopseudomonas daroniae]|uniref:hypothetical protein n=1 Tax=Phytopseudomonas daroniae TaxID=2487519 RepID=UPI0010385816|nr:hypothetical protein [Pseudomonas daroniae]TBU77007.1 hypothetical protein DNK10_05585 [Pseudomonas daroniae]
MRQPYPRLCTLTACLLLMACEQQASSSAIDRPVRETRFAERIDGFPAADNEFETTHMEDMHRSQPAPEATHRQPVEIIGNGPLTPRTASSGRLVF